MKQYVIFLRGINVGGNSIISMKDLTAMCTDVGFRNVQTYINSGNILFESTISENILKAKLEGALLRNRNKETTVVIRTPSELESILKKNPFPKAPPAKLGIVLFHEKIPASFKKEFEALKNKGPEQVSIASREMYIYYPDGMDKSTLRLPKLAIAGTTRNLNTVTKMAALAKQKQKPKTSQKLKK